jgi:hypothetical protein
MTKVTSVDVTLYYEDGSKVTLESEGELRNLEYSLDANYSNQREFMYSRHRPVERLLSVDISLSAKLLPAPKTGTIYTIRKGVT